MIGNLPTQQSRSPRVVIIIFLIVALFGLFWYRESRRIQQERHVIPSLATGTTNSETSSSPPIDLRDLEANAVNIAIPSFDELF